MNIPSVLLNTTKSSLGDSTLVTSARLTKSFMEKTHYKLVAISRVLNAGYKVLYMDSDIILTRNPFPYLNSLKPTHLISQKDDYICSGFMFIYPTLLSRRVFNLTTYEITDDDDQGIIIRVAKREGLNATLLPTDLFVSGKPFFKNHQYYWDLKNESLYQIHNNYIRGGIGKTLRMKEMKRYYLDKKGEYSNPTQKYLTFELLKPGHHEYLQTTDKIVFRQLKRMVKVANALNRSLIIPPIPCKKPGVPFCNICFFHYRYCFEEILRNATQLFKESVCFLYVYNK